MKKTYYFLPIAFFLWACKAEQVVVPSYVNVGTYNVVTSYAAQGTNNQSFSDMAINANGNSYGTFPIGINMPVIASGPTSLLIQPLIEINGVGLIRSVYELMNACDTTITITQGKVTQIIPEFQYYPNVKFRIMDDFNFGTPNLFTQNDTCSSLSPNGFGGGVGNKCLKMSPWNGVQYCSVTTNSSYFLPAGGVGVYIEYNYLSNIDIGFTLTGASNGNSAGLGGSHPSANWNKSYLYITQQVSTINDPVGYYLKIYCNYTDSVGTNAAYLDNLKVISRQ